MDNLLTMPVNRVSLHWAKYSKILQVTAAVMSLMEWTPLRIMKDDTIIG